MRGWIFWCVFAGGLFGFNSTVRAEGILVPAPNRVDMAYDDVRSVLYVSNGGEYVIFESTAAGQEAAMPVSAGVLGTTIVISGLNDNTSYYFEVAATNGYGTGAPSNETSATPIAPPAPPQNLSATVGNGQITLNWAASANAFLPHVDFGSPARDKNKG